MKTEKKKTEKEVKNQPQKKKLTAKQRRDIEDISREINRSMSYHFMINLLQRKLIEK